LEQTRWERGCIVGRLWDQEAGLVAVPGVGDFIRSRIPQGYWLRYRVDEEELQVKYTILASPSRADDSEVPVVAILEAIAEEIPKMFPGLFIKVHAEDFVPGESDDDVEDETEPESTV